MFVELAMGDRQAHLVEQRPPTQGVRQLVILQLPAFGHLTVQPHGRVADALRLGALHMMAAHQRLDAAFAHVLVGESTQQVIQKTFAQRAAGHFHLINAQLLEDAIENRQPGGKDRPAILAQPLQIQLLHLAGLDHLLAGLFQALHGDAGL